MIGASAAGLRHLPAERLARPEHADAGVAARDTGLVGVILDRDAVDLDAPERRSVLGLERVRELADTLAHDRREPLIAPAILRAPNLAVGNIVMALLGAAWIPLWFFLNMYLQGILGYGAFHSGLALLPMTLTIMVLMVAATEKVVGRIGPKSALVIGLGALGLALVLFARMPLNGTFVADVLLPSLLGAVGMSLAYIPAMITSTMGARPEDGGLASGLVNTTYQVGAAIGLAAMVAVASGGSSIHAGFTAAFIGAAVIAFVGAGVAAFALRTPRGRATM